MVDACESEQTSLLYKYVLNRKEELTAASERDDSAAGPKSISPFVPCAASRIPYILQSARLTEDDVLFDLGCGDGIILHEAALRCQCRCVGLEIDTDCLALAKARAEELGIDHLCTWIHCDLLAMPRGALANPRLLLDADRAASLPEMPSATVALVFLTAPGLVKLSPWLHEEWKESKTNLRLLTCVESLDTVIDYSDPAGVFAETNACGWQVSREHARWGVFLVPPPSMSVSAWEAAGCQPLCFSKSEAEATSPLHLTGFLTPEEVSIVDETGQALLALQGGGSDESSLSLFDLGDAAGENETNFHAAIEDAMHFFAEHRVLHLHGVANLFEDFPKMKLVTEKIIASVKSSEPWGLLRWREVNVRCLEYHAYSTGGSVMDPEHRDDGSLVTLSVLLSPEESFSGGRFVTWQSGAKKEHDLAQGDGILFVSEKRHNVQKVVGDRRALILELWEGPINKHNRHC